MDRSRLEICPKLWLDHRRAVFLEEQRTLAVADLHLGYAWAHRFNGQMLPLEPNDDILARLEDLCGYYNPKTIVLLGDIVHQAAPVIEIAGELSALLEALAARGAVQLLLGNHDRNLKRMLPSHEKMGFHQSLRSGEYLLLHGHEPSSTAGSEFIIMGHEHPAIYLGDGIKSAKFPCFLASERLLILPAFSGWVAGTNVRAYGLMSSLARAAHFTKAIAICGAKLLPVPL
jgi:DNA ligase-associated metallophosphoesterase